MANTVTTTVLEDGARFKTLKVQVHLDTSDLAPTAIADPATSYFDPVGQNQNQFAINKASWGVPGTLSALIYFEGTPNSLALSMTDSQDFDFCDFGDIQNDATAKTGKVLVATQGYVAASTVDFSFVIVLKKC